MVVLYGTWFNVACHSWAPYNPRKNYDWLRIWIGRTNPKGSSQGQSRQRMRIVFLFWLFLCFIVIVYITGEPIRMSGSKLKTTRIKLDILDKDAENPVLIHSCTCAKDDFGSFFFPKRLWVRVCLQSKLPTSFRLVFCDFFHLFRSYISAPRHVLNEVCNGW